MFKRVKVVMLPTNEKATIIGKYKDVDELVFNTPRDIPRGEQQHLYILSDEEIKEGDWCISVKRNQLFQVEEVTDNHYVPTDFKNKNWTPRKEDCKKIIATTDSSLIRVVESFKGEVIEERLPQPSQSFITKYVEKYNKGNIISDVMIEYEEHGITCNQCYKVNGGINSPDCCGEYYIKDIVKVNPKDNTITIKKVKNSFTLQEIEEIHVSVVKQGCLYEGGSWTDEHERLVRIEFNKYVKENL